MIEFNFPPTPKTNQPEGGQGAASGRSSETGLCPRETARLNDLAVRRGWMKGQRWPLDATIEDFVAIEKQRKLTMREQIALSVMRDSLSASERCRGIACRTGVAMESQNQRDELPEGRNVAAASATAIVINLADADREHLEEARRLRAERQQRLSGNTIEETNGHGSNGNAGHAGANGQQGPLANGSAPELPEQPD